MIIAGTGHRPDKLGGYSVEARTRLETFAEIIVRELNPHTVISGMALGWDQALAWAAVRTGVHIVAAIPFEGQERLWTDDQKKNYRHLRSLADVHVLLPGGYAPSKMQHRNEWMVRRLPLHEDRLIALWNGSDGGTANCVAYGTEQLGANRVVNVWERWVEFQKPARS